jgi:hypothetical protein
MSRDESRSRVRSSRGVLGQLERVLFSRPAAAISAALSVGIFLGCMSISIGCRTAEEAKPCPDDSSVLAQEGKVRSVHLASADQTIYYPIPYAAPPNLELHDPHGIYTVVEQKETHFRVRVSHTVGSTWDGDSVTWKARGVRCPPPAPPASTPPAEAAPPALLPPNPLPATVEGSGGP